jgi:hypothetical protein
MIIKKNKFKNLKPGLTVTVSLQNKYQKYLKKKMPSASMTVQTNKSCKEILDLIKVILGSEF